MVVGAAVLGAGLIGLLLALGLVAARALVPAVPVALDAGMDEPSPNEVIAATGSATDQDATATTDAANTPADDASASAASEDAADQNGSSGSTATATKISVK
ncbi:hypothetical protein [Microbacterium sp. PF5]|uniref:hypothetical protein n=1 Tax=Microbacterium sp. PF5 TaxID=2305435 RepID=UPI001F0E2745|nr:hypothetical protein [Microbacterium sp. PF5]